MTIANSDTYTLTVDVIPGEDYTSVVFVFGTEDDPAIKSGEVWVQNSDSLSVAGKVGVYAMGGEVTFTDFSVEPIEVEPEPTETEPTEPEETKPEDTKPAESRPQGSQPQDEQPQPQGTPTGLIIGICAAVVVVVAVVVIVILKKKK